LLNNMFCWCVSLTVDSWRLPIIVPVRQRSYLYVFFLKLLQTSFGHDHVKGHRTVPGDSIHSTVKTHVIEMRDTIHNVTVTFKMNIWNLKLKRHKGLKATWNIEIWLKKNIKVNRNVDRGCSVAVHGTIPLEYGEQKILVLGCES
jgi:hypothetical protein